jgi:hypothetical protein
MNAPTDFRLVAGPPRLNEHAIGLDGDAFVVGEMSCSEGLYTVGPLNVSFRMQPNHPGAGPTSS